MIDITAVVIKFRKTCAVFFDYQTALKSYMDFGDYICAGSLHVSRLSVFVWHPGFRQG